MKFITISVVAASFWFALTAGAQAPSSSAVVAARHVMSPAPASVAHAQQSAPAAGAVPQNSQQTTTGSTPKPEEPPRALEPNKPIVRDMTGGETHTYTVSLDPEQFLHVVVDQRGIDVVVSLVSPDDAVLAEVDSPNGTSGLEPVFWITQSGGTYKVQVQALAKDAPAGKYEIKMDPPRAPTEQDGVRVQAQKAFIEGRKVAARPGEGHLLMAKLRFEDSLRGWQAVGDHERAEQTAVLIDAVYDGISNMNLRRGNNQEAFLTAQERLEFDNTNFGPNSIHAVSPMRTMAYLLENRGAFAQAEKIRKDEVSIAQKAAGAESLAYAASLGDLAQLYARQSKFAQAEPLMKNAVSICEKAEGPDHADVATALVQLADLYRTEKRYGDAQQDYQRAVAIFDKQKAPSPTEGFVLANYARNQIEQGRYAEAEQLAQRSVAISEKAFNADHPAVAESLLEMGSVYVKEKKYADADAACQRALTIYDKAQGVTSVNSMRALLALLGVYSQEGKEAETEPLLQRVQTMVTKAPDTLKALRGGAAQKDALGMQYALGVLYEKGQGVKQDSAEALKWYGAAADNGDALACVRIARVHENGLGVPKDSIEAYKWYALAGAGHPDWEEHKRQLVAQLSPEQLSDAQKRVAAWQSQHLSKP